MKKNKIFFLLPALILFLLILSFAPTERENSYPEIKNILQTNNLGTQAQLYKQLIERIGIIEAQKALVTSGLPFNGETHLLNHTSGEYTYQKYGMEGLSYCKDYFLASCYHQFILSVVADYGMGGLQNIMTICWKKGAPVATQCAHAVGHGLLAWSGYINLPQALELCDSLKEKDSRFPLLNCHDGVFMENLWAVHENGIPSENRWIKESDPYYPCTDPRIKDKWQIGCWMNQASIMYQLFQNDIKRVSQYCGTVSTARYQEICYDNLARQIHPLTENNVDKAFRLCGLLEGEWKHSCLLSLVKTDFSVGGRILPYQICVHMESIKKPGCYHQLYKIIHAYYSDSTEAKKQCAPITDLSYQKQCNRTLGNNQSESFRKKAH